MVAVPAHGPGDVQGELRRRSVSMRGNLVADHLRGVVVAVVHQGDALARVAWPRSSGQTPRCPRCRLPRRCRRPCDSTQGLTRLKSNGSERISSMRLPCSACRGPMRSAGTSLKPSPVQMFMTQGCPSSSARYWLMRMQALPCSIQKRRVFSLGEDEGQRVAHGVGEEGGVEVAAQAARLAEVHPLLEMLGFQLVPVQPSRRFLIENGVAGVQVQLLGAGAQLEHQVQVGHAAPRGCGRARDSCRWSECRR